MRRHVFLQVLVAVLEHTPSSAELINMQEQLVSTQITRQNWALGGGHGFDHMLSNASDTALQDVPVLPAVLQMVAVHSVRWLRCTKSDGCGALSLFRLLLQVGFTVAAGIVARLASVFSLFDQPMQQAARPVPPHVLQVCTSPAGC